MRFGVGFLGEVGRGILKKKQKNTEIVDTYPLVSSLLSSQKH